MFAARRSKSEASVTKWRREDISSWRSTTPHLSVSNPSSKTASMTAEACIELRENLYKHLTSLPQNIFTHYLKTLRRLRPACPPALAALTPVYPPCSSFPVQSSTKVVWVHQNSLQSSFSLANIRLAILSRAPTVFEFTVLVLIRTSRRALYRSGVHLTIFSWLFVLHHFVLCAIHCDNILRVCLKLVLLQKT